MQYIINRLKSVIKSNAVDFDLSSFIARSDYSQKKDSDDELRRIIESLANEDSSKKFTGEQKYFTRQSEPTQENKQERPKATATLSAKDKEAIKSASSILGVSENANFSEIKEAYRKQLMKFHPDKTGKLGKDLQEIGALKTQEIIYAFNILKRLKEL